MYYYLHNIKKIIIQCTIQVIFFFIETFLHSSKSDIITHRLMSEESRDRINAQEIKAYNFYFNIENFKIDKREKI